MAFVGSVSLRRGLRTCAFVLFAACWAVSARAQFVSISGGGLFSQDLSSAAPQRQFEGSGARQLIGGTARSQFDHSGLLAVDAGLSFLPFLSGALHYSYSRPELFLSRGDAFGSSARVGLRAHTFTLDARLRTPEIFGVRLYGLAGVGFSRFVLDVKQPVEVPFPRGAPESVVSPVFTFGGGVEKSLAPWVRLKLEVRDYLSPISEDLFRPGGAWHRVGVLGGIVLGR